MQLTRRLAGARARAEIECMTPKTLMEEILRLPVEDRLRLVEDVWDSIAAEPDAVPVPDWHRRELDRRLAEPSPEYLSAEEVQRRLDEAN